MAPFGISVIICTNNGAKHIGPALEALENQNIPDDLQWEILLIDNGSTDDTFNVVENIKRNFKKDIQFRIISEPIIGKSNALIKGYNEAKFELMLICDDDNWLQPEYLQNVACIFRRKPEIGLLGGYGIAEFSGEEKPVWFDKWQQLYACGKHHEKSGFLAPGDFSIWGAGSVIRKTMWVFLQKNGFHFINNTRPGAMLGEDLELSHAVNYSGSKLYSDENLWFYHDLSGGRITRKKLREQLRKSGSALFVIYAIASKNSPDKKNKYNISFVRMLISLAINLLVQSLKRNNEPMRNYLFIQLTELASQRKKYRLVYDDIFPWVSKVKGSFPLKDISI